MGKFIKRNDMRAVLLLIVWIFFESLVSVKSTECEKIVSIESTEVVSYLGNVTFKAPVSVHGNWTLIMKTAVPFNFIGGWHVRVISDAANGTAKFENLEEIDIKAGDKISFRFRIYFGDRHKIPHVNYIQWEKRNICKGTFRNLRKIWTLSDLETSFDGSSIQIQSDKDNEFRRRRRRPRGA